MCVAYVCQCVQLALAELEVLYDGFERIDGGFQQKSKCGGGKSEGS